METRDVLLELKEGPVTGSALAESYGVSRNAVWKHVEELRGAGFSVESTPEGYRVTEVPEYGGYAIQYHLPSDCFVDQVEYREKVASTNTEAEELARDGAMEGVVVAAERQTEGRGRRERRWASPEGGVWMSVVLRPEVSTRDASLITLAASVAVAGALEGLGLEPRIKWPNDITLDEQKVCGILVEMQADAESIDYAVVGVGLNANVVPDVDVDATSVMEVLGRRVDRAELAAGVLENFESAYTDDDVLELWRQRSSTLGREVRVETPNETIEGTAVGVDSGGALRVDTPAGERVVSVGDCRHLR